MAPRPSAPVPCDIPTCKKAAVCLVEKAHMAGKLRSGLSYGAGGPELRSVSHQQDKGSLKQKHT